MSTWSKQAIGIFIADFFVVILEITVIFGFQLFLMMKAFKTIKRNKKKKEEDEKKTKSYENKYRRVKSMKKHDMKFDYDQMLNNITLTY